MKQTTFRSNTTFNYQRGTRLHNRISDFIQLRSNQPSRIVLKTEKL